MTPTRHAVIVMKLDTAVECNHNDEGVNNDPWPMLRAIVNSYGWILGDLWNNVEVVLLELRFSNSMKNIRAIRVNQPP